MSQGQDWYLLPDKPDRRLKLQLSVDIEDFASNKQEELMVEGMMQCKTDGREEVI